MKKLYLTLAIVGAIVPYYFFIQFFRAEGFSLLTFCSALFANGAAGGCSADLLISSFVFWAFMIFQNKKANWPKPLLFIILNLTIGLSCALPAYLYAQTKAAEKLSIQ